MDLTLALIGVYPSGDEPPDLGEPRNARTCEAGGDKRSSRGLFPGIRASLWTYISPVAVIYSDYSPYYFILI